MECEIAIVNSNKDEIKEIFKNTKSIAIIGCSPNETKDSNMVAKYLINHGVTVYPVYPKEDIILGQKVYRSLEEIPFQVDMVDIFRKPAVIASVVDSAILKGGIKCIWTQLGLVNNDAMQKAQKAGILTVQNRCTKIEHKIL
jgi:predicted CoA-binding protein